jgi:UDP:flavonoid glycosyltransferase YjiC (YdhE family)
MPKINGKGKIYVSLGTIFNRDLNKYLSILKHLNYKVIITAPEKYHKKLSEFGEVYEAIDLEHFFNTKPLAAITNGGLNTLQLAVRYSVPVLITPSIFEQSINGNLFEKIKIGKIIKNPKKIREYLKQLSHKNNLKEYAYLCDQGDDVSIYIEKLIKRNCSNKVYEITK